MWTIPASINIHFAFKSTQLRESFWSWATRKGCEQGNIWAVRWVICSQISEVYGSVIKLGSQFTVMIVRMCFWHCLFVMGESLQKNMGNNKY